MDKPSLIRNALRQAQLYGYLVARTDRLYHPGGTRPLCGLQTAHEMVRQELLVIRNGRYEITPKGLRVGEPRSPLKD
jgi:hypothetical protein